MSLNRLFVLVAIVAIGSFAFADLSSELTNESFSLRDLGKYKRAMAMDFAKELNNEAFRNFVVSNLGGKQAKAPLVSMMREYAELSRCCDLSKSIANLDLAIRKVKGVETRVDELLEARVVGDSRCLGNCKLLVAYVPDGNEKSWNKIEAFDVEGNSHVLEVYQAPETPVIVLALDGKKDMRAGLALLNEELQKAGMQSTVTPDSRENLEVAKLNYIRLNDDQEPWISGDAEIYTLVNGIAPEASKSNIISMEMPYLTDDEENYYPNQVLIIWKNYRYMAANLNIYEHDDSTNYKEIAAFLIEKIGNVVPEYQYIFDIASQIIKLMPDEWFTNDDDFVDVFYTLEKGKTYTNYLGASKNATITLVPYTISGE